MDLLRNVLLIGIAVVFGFWVLIYFMQDAMLFFPPPASDHARFDNLPGVQAVDLTVDGIKLRGWLVQPNTPGPHALVIYFGGNGEEVSPMVTQARRFPGCALLVMNYRGYGSSEGKPSEQALLADALAVYDYATALPGVDGKHIIAMGRSLGSGVAVALAASRLLAGVILVTPYDSMVEVARTHYPLLPVSLLLKHRFESVARAPAIHAPALVLTAGDDRVIPRKHSDALYAAWGGPKSRLEIAGADHNSIDAYPVYWSVIAAFLQKMTTTTLAGMATS